MNYLSIKLCIYVLKQIKNPVEAQPRTSEIANRLKNVKKFKITLCCVDTYINRSTFSKKNSTFKDLMTGKSPRSL